MTKQSTKTDAAHNRFLNEDELKVVREHDAAIAHHNEQIKHHSKERRKLTNRAMNRARAEGMKLILASDGSEPTGAEPSEADDLALTGE